MKEYIAARKVADEEFDKLLKAFHAVQDINPAYQFTRHLAEHGDRYRKAWDARNEAGGKLKPTDLVRSMQIFDSAQARAEKVPG